MKAKACLELAMCKIPEIASLNLEILHVIYNIVAIDINLLAIRRGEINRSIRSGNIGAGNTFGR